MVSINVVAVIAAVAICVPSAVVGFAFWALERKLEKRDKDDEAKKRKERQEAEDAEKRRQENELMTLQCVHASLALGEATAKAVQRIPDAHCNGDMDEALKYASETKHAQKAFIEKAGIKEIYSTKEEKHEKN
jgi:flagellar biosynthesis component FlhA